MKARTARPHHTPVPRARIVAAVVALALFAALLPGFRCNQNKLPAPQAGLRQHQAPAQIQLARGLTVNAIGGNLHLAYRLLSIDTHLGEWRAGAAYNSATGVWLFSHDMTYDGLRFVDPSGALHDVSALADGSRVPGTHWVKVNATRMKTLGGRVYAFGANARLRAVFWAGQPHPRLVFTHGTVSGATRITRVRQCIDAAGTCMPVFDMTYDAAARLTKITDRAGREVHLAYDAAGNLETLRDPLAVEQGWPGFRFGYSGSQLTSIRTSEGEETQIGYGGANAPRVALVRYVGVNDPEYVFGYARAGSGWKTTVTDPVGEVTEYAYTATRRLQSVTNPLGELVSFGWTPDLRIASLTDPAGVTTTWSYTDTTTTMAEPSGNVVVTESPPYTAPVTNRAAPLERPVVRIEDSVGPVLQQTFDTQGRVETVVNGEGETTQLAYDGLGHLSSVTSPGGVTTTFEDYGEHGHPEAVLGASGISDAPTYDDVGNQLTGLDIRGPLSPGRPGIVARSFDANRNVASLDLVDESTIPRSIQPLTIERRSDGRILRIVRPYGGEARFDYDALGRLTERREKVDGLWQSTRFAYDAAGRRSSLELDNGMRRELEYDAAGRVTTVKHVRHGVVEQALTSTWDEGRLVARFDTTYGAPETFSYDAAGRVNAVTFPGGEAMVTTYDLRSRPIGTGYFLDTGGVLRAFQREYDLADRNTTVVDLTAGETLVERSFAEGRIDAETFGNGLTRTYGYDPTSGLPVGSSTSGGAESTSVEWTFGAYGAQDSFALGITTVTSLSVPTVTEGHISQDNASGRHALTGSSYDALNNPVGLGYVYNAERNRLVALTQSGAIDYVYDDAGYMIERKGDPITWTASGRIASVGADVFAWDASGRLTSMTRGGLTVQTRFGGVVRADAMGGLQTLDLGFVRLDLAGPGRLYRHLDVRNNVAFLTDEHGDVVKQYRYRSGSIWQEHGATDDDRTFHGGTELGDGLILLGARVYDSETGRFISPDPVYQVVSQYVYAEGNPNLLWDHDGRQAEVLSSPYGGAGAVAVGFQEGLGAIGPATISAAARFAHGIAAGFRVVAAHPATPPRVRPFLAAAGEIFDAAADAASNSGDDGNGAGSGGDAPTSGGSSDSGGSESDSEAGSSAPLPDLLGNGDWYDRVGPYPPDKDDDDNNAMGPGGGGGGGGGNGPGGPGGCSPTRIAIDSAPTGAWRYAVVLVPVQLLLGLLVLTRRRRRSHRLWFEAAAESSSERE